MCLAPVESAINNIQLLFTSQSNKVDSIAGDANGQVRVILGMIHRIEKHLTIEHIHVHVVTGRC